MEIEIWKQVVGYEDTYAVSNFGNVKRIRSAKGSSYQTIMKAAPNRYGYPRLSLSRYNCTKQFLVHRIVAAAFLGPCPPQHEVNHIDGNPRNAHLDNLEYVTSKQNSEHAVRLGLMPFGRRRTNAKLSDDLVKEIRSVFALGNLRLQDLATKYKVSRRTIDDAINRRTWNHVA